MLKFLSIYAAGAAALSKPKHKTVAVASTAAPTTAAPTTTTTLPHRGSVLEDLKKEDPAIVEQMQQQLNPFDRYHYQTLKSDQIIKIL